MSASKRGDEPEEDQEAAWRSLSQRVAVGAVYRLRDDQVIPTSASGKSHPYAIIAGGPAPGDTPRVALSRFVQLSVRTSFKPDDHGPLPTTEEEQDEFRHKGAVFSPAGDPASLDLPGIFSLNQFNTRVSALARGEFLGWLPRDVIHRLTFRMNRPAPSLPYPPVGSV